MNPVISTVIPAYNAERFLRDAISSALNQTIPPDEIIVVDDGSTDRTAGIAQGFGGRVRYLHQPNNGVVAARTRGIEAARGEWIAFLDSDDAWFSRKLEWQIRVLESLSEPALICGGATSFTERIPEAPRDEETGPPEDVTYSRLLCRNRVCTSTVVLPKKWIGEIGGLDSRYDHAEDWAVWLKLAGLGKSIKWISCPLAAYRLRPDSLSERSIHMLRDVELQIMEDSFVEYGRSGDGNLKAQATACVHLRMAIDFLESGKPAEALSNILRSLRNWPFALAEYASTARLIRLRLLLRSLLNLRRSFHKLAR